MAEPILSTVRRTRTRRQKFPFDKTAIAKRVVDFYNRDIEARGTDRDRRLQRYAKYRQWTEGKEWPWEGSSDQAVPDLMTTAEHMKDILHNAVMSTRPAVVAKAVRKDQQVKSRAIDNLTDYQFFVEQPGEQILGEYADVFVNDGNATAFIAWVREDRKVIEVRTFGAIPEGQAPIDYFRRALNSVFPQSIYQQKDAEGWDWDVRTLEGDQVQVSFFTKKNRLEMEIARTTRVFDGPRVFVKGYEEVLAPARAANLQMPSPSNPNGATHVVIVDFPNVDEIRRLQKQGFYDLIKAKDVDDLERLSEDRSRDEFRSQTDAFQGVSQTRDEDGIAPRKPGRPSDGKNVGSHRTLTRLTCFDLFDVDGDGVNEDMIFWVIKEDELLLKAKALSEMYPSNPPRRPFAEATFLPVKGRRDGIGLLEQMEGLHDWRKESIDQMMDFGTLEVMPFGFYRAASSIKPEVLRPWPGDLIPVSDPQNDVNIPNFNRNSQVFHLNTMALIQQMEEKLTSVGDLQHGRVPAGKASALRTLGGMQTIMSQGEARPERVLRRYFMGLTEIWQWIHRLNKHFLPEQKKFRVAGFLQAGEDPYQEVSREDLARSDFDFTFQANVANASKEALRASLEAMMSAFISPIAVQLGLVTPEGVFRMFRDWARALGQNPDQYLQAPSPAALRPRIVAEEAISQLLEGQLPDALPRGCRSPPDPSGVRPGRPVRADAADRQRGEVPRLPHQRRRARPSRAGHRASRRRSRTVRPRGEQGQRRSRRRESAAAATTWSR
jgi:hypothetical protein